MTGQHEQQLMKAISADRLRRAADQRLANAIERPRRWRPRGAVRAPFVRHGQGGRPATEYRG